MAAIMSMTPQQYAGWLALNSAKIASERVASIRTTGPKPVASASVADFVPPDPYAADLARLKSGDAPRVAPAPAVPASLAAYVPPDSWGLDKLKGAK
jgi:hypothetical protein